LIHIAILTDHMDQMDRLAELPKHIHVPHLHAMPLVVIDVQTGVDMFCS